MRMLVIAPHPDDEVIGCGGTILKNRAEGGEAFLCVVTAAHPPEWNKKIIKTKKEERAKAAKLLGIKKSLFLDFPATKLDTISQSELIKKISTCVKAVKPESVFVSHWGDLHKDHKVVFDAAMVATRPFNTSVKKVLCYEIPSSTSLVPNKEAAFLPNVFVDISNVLEKKLEIMKVYKTELRKHPHPRSIEALRVHAKKRGTQIGVKAAEAFVLVRHIG